MRIVFALLLLAGCPARPSTTPQPVTPSTCEDVAWSCVRVTPGTQHAWSCVEGDASQTATYQATCTAQDGRFALNACLRDDLVGGCTRAPCTTTWYYAPATRASVERDCAKQGAVFVAP